MMEIQDLFGRVWRNGIYQGNPRFISVKYLTSLNDNWPAWISSTLIIAYPTPELAKNFRARRAVRTLLKLFHTVVLHKLSREQARELCMRYRIYFTLK
jgi:hypothetical protein